MSSFELKKQLGQVQQTHDRVVEFDSVTDIVAAIAQGEQLRFVTHPSRLPESIHRQAERFDKPLVVLECPSHDLSGQGCWCETGLMRVCHLSQNLVTCSATVFVGVVRADGESSTKR